VRHIWEWDDSTGRIRTRLRFDLQPLAQLRQLI
jgi:hypothetical protein